MHEKIRPALGAGVFAALAAAAWSASAGATGDRPARPPARRGPGAWHAAACSTRSNLYSETGAGRLGPGGRRRAGARLRAQPAPRTTVSVIDPETLKVIDTLQGRRRIRSTSCRPGTCARSGWPTTPRAGTDGSLTPIDPTTGKPGKSIAVDDPYNMYCDARRQAGDRRRRGVQAARLPRPADDEAAATRWPTPACAGINHADFSIDGRLRDLHLRVQRHRSTKIDLVNRKVLGTIRLSKYFARPEVLAVIDKPGKKPKKCPTRPAPARSAPPPGMPQDIRISPDGKRFYVADMMADGVHVIDGETLQADRLHRHRRRRSRPVPQPRRQEALRRQPRQQRDPRQAGGPGQRLGDRLRQRQGARRPGRSRAAAAPTWAMSAPTASTSGSRAASTTSSTAIETTPGAVDKIKVGHEPHGLTVWPQPGRYSLGHTGNLR